ncbi:GTPase-activating protein [Apophysomyces sp. BC1034]|nr:GTPase-activating protein [Apophysomyces sp. BC1015]KAG0169146.1 GTPase-activating protein [Apophysomyces sp. BC1021]KAG0184312.1 GTPase-activating protein [Apophysomyces sp. BC1034]
MSTAHVLPTVPGGQESSHMLDTHIQPHDDDDFIFNGPSRSHSSSSTAELSDDSQSRGSVDTVATEKTKDENTHDRPSSPTKRSRGRGMTVTQHPHPAKYTGESGVVAVGEQMKDDLAEIHHQIHDLQQVPVADGDSDSDSETTGVRRQRNQSHRSTVSSVSSFVSSASNYDLLLARLGPPDTQHTEAQPSLECIPNEPVHKGEEDEIDWEFWSKVISDFGGVAKSEPQVLSYHIQRGIPPSLRGMVWQLLAKSKDTALEDKYMQLLKQESVYEKAISRDMTRTFSHHEYFQRKEGQEALFNVVKAYSLYDPEMPEEEAFSVLVQMMNRYGLRGHFLPQPDLLLQRLYQLEGLFTDHLPQVRRHFEVQGIRAHMYASQWFLTLFAYKLPLDTVFRVYDIILAEGIDTIHRFSLALLEKNQATILSLELEGLMQYLKSDVLEVYKTNPSLFIHEAFQIKIIPKRLERLAKEYQVEAARANTEAEAVELLRRQNKALAETIRHLEDNVKDNNKDHERVANELIVTKMETARLHDENDALRQQSYDLKKALETLPQEVEARVKQEMEILCTKNTALVQRNSALEDQLVYMENMVIEFKVKYAESENEREALRQRLADLKRLMG